MFNSKLASLEARIARLESSLQNKTAAGWSPQSGAVMKLKDLFSIMKKTMQTQFGVDKTDGFSEAQGWFDVKSSAPYMSMGLGYSEFEPALEPFVIDWKLEIDQLPSMVGGSVHDDSDYPLIANFHLFLNGRKVGWESVTLSSTQTIVKQLKELDKKLALLNDKYNG